jgi:hypothetical protein
MLSCGMLVWDAPENEDCCRDTLSYKVRFYNGTSYAETERDYRKVMKAYSSWLEFTADDLPPTRPLHVEVKTRKQDGVHSRDWMYAGLLTDSYIMDCPK